MNSIIRSNRVPTGFVVISTGDVDSAVFQSDASGKPIDWQPLESYHFGDGDDDLSIHRKLIGKWGC